ncbi:MAG: alpha/beta hydrolase [Ignavibacteriales bacterium]|nr:MAG: alpha/beta hydrolase [Ignavibacteriales bacterium]
MQKDFSLFTAANNEISVTIYGYESFDKNPVLIYVHGFKGFKDWGFVPYTAEYFTEKGYTVITFNFSHNGIGAVKDEFTELEKFGKNTYSLETSELSEIIDAYLFGFFGENPKSKVGLIGHSRGGAVALLTAKKRKEVSVLAVWSSISKVDRYTERQKKEWIKNGFIEVVNSRTNQSMKLDKNVLDDIENNKEKKLNIENAVKKYNRPLIIIHGEQDLTVPVKEGECIYEWSNKKKTKFVTVPAAGHTFDIVHPFAGTNQKFNTVLVETEQFFNKNLF